MIHLWENQRAGRLTLFYRRVAGCQQHPVGNDRSGSGDLTLQTKKEGRALPMYVTYTDLIQIGIFICTLVGVCYTIFKGKR
jgi:hypothetical protein